MSKRCMVSDGLVIIQVHNLELAFVLQILFALVKDLLRLFLILMILNTTIVDLGRGLLLFFDRFPHFGYIFILDFHQFSVFLRKLTLFGAQFLGLVQCK